MTTKYSPIPTESEYWSLLTVPETHKQILNILVFFSVLNSIQKFHILTIKILWFIKVSKVLDSPKWWAIKVAENIYFKNCQCPKHNSKVIKTNSIYNSNTNFKVREWFLSNDFFPPDPGSKTHLAPTACYTHIVDMSLKRFFLEKNWILFFNGHITLV